MDVNKKEFDPLNIWSTTSSINKFEAITPHKIVVVFLVQEYLKVKNNECEQNGLYPPKYRKGFSMLLLKLIQYPDMSYKELHAFLRSPHIETDSKYLRRFEELMETISTTGIDILFDLQIFIGNLLTDNNNVNQFGIVGFYIRRILLALNKMSFSDIIEFYKNLNLYYEKGRRALAFTEASNTTDNVDKSMNSADMLADTRSMQQDSLIQQTFSFCLPSPMVSKDIKNGHSKWSVKQADLFIAQQCNFLGYNEARALRPAELQQRLKEISEDIPFYTQSHILSYMNNLRVQDFYNAVDAFHRVYDRSAMRSNTAVNNNSSIETNQTTNNVKSNKGLQYSSLNLAILHIQFNHFTEALASLRECVMLAQEASDKFCLQLAQSWLCLLDKKYVLLCETSVTNQLENSSVHAVSLGVQFIVNVAVASGTKLFNLIIIIINCIILIVDFDNLGVLPAKLFELLMKSEILNFQHNLTELIANCLSQKAAIWQLYGKTEIASLCNQLLLQVIRTNKESDCVENSEPACLSLCCVALWLSLQGELVLSSVVLQHANECFPRSPLAHHWQLTEAYITMQQAIYRSKWSEATRACSQLYVFDKNLGILQKSMLNIIRGNWMAAQRQLQALLRDEQLQPIHRVRAMILIANTYFFNKSNSSNDNDCSTYYSGEVVGILNEAYNYAKEKYLAYEAAIVDLHTTYVLLHMGLAQQALKLIKSLMETIFASGGIYDSSKTKFLFVQCLVASQANRNEKIARLNESLPILEECIQNFNKLEAYAKVKDIYLYLANLCNSINLMPERNKWAYRFHDLEEQFPTPVEQLNIFL